MKKSCRGSTLRIFLRGFLPLVALLCVLMPQVVPVGPSIAVPTAHAGGGPTITSISFSSTTPTPTVSITGVNLGAQPTPGAYQPSNAQACPGSGFSGSDYAYQQYGFDDTNLGGTWDSGQEAPDGSIYVNCIGINFTNYSDTAVTFNFGDAYNFSYWYISSGDNFTVYIAGASCSGVVSFGEPISCSGAPPTPAPNLTLAETHPGSTSGTYNTAVFGQFTGASPNTSYSLNFYAACGAAGSPINGTPVTVTTDSTGTAPFSPTIQVPNNLAGQQISATAITAGSALSAASNCQPVTQGNDSWDTALQLWSDAVAPPPSASVSQSIYTLGQERWYDFPVVPGAQVHLAFTGQAGSVLSLHTDIQQLYSALTNSSTASQVAADLAVQDAPSGYLPSGYLPSGYLPSGYLPSGYLPSGYLPSGYLPSGYLPSGYLPSGYLPSGYLPSGYLPSGYLPSGYLPSGYLPSGYLPSGYLPSGYLSGPYQSVERQSLMAIATSPTATSLTIDRNTWNLTGHLYVRVAGPPGSFTLTVTEAGGACANVTSTPVPVTGLPVVSPPPTTLILYDSTRWDPTRAGNGSADISSLQSKLTAFAQRSGVNGQLIDLSTIPAVTALNSQADGNAACPAAKNLVATQIKAVIQYYRATYPAGSIQYIVLVGDDHSIPFFRYPDESGLAPENGYIPPVSDSSPTQASLRDNYILGQDEYGSSSSIPRGGYSLPVPGIPVGRLTGSAADAGTVLDAYTTTGGVITPTTSLVTGYDFVADAAASAAGNLAAGTNGTPDQLITPQGASTSSGWTANNLRPLLLGKHHDIVFLAGHFSAGNLLAADYATQVNASEVVTSTTSFANTLVLALGCHGGLNIPSQDAITGVSPSPDWPEAFASRGATLVAATGYAYGDTVLEEYGEWYFVDLTQQLRTGTGVVSLGAANVAAKQAYLSAHVSLSGIDEKTLLETTLYGLPMLGVNMPGTRLTPSTAAPIVHSVAAVIDGPGNALGLAVGQDATGSTNITVSPTSTLNTTKLTDPSGNPVTATWYSGPNGGVVAHPLDPVFPLQLYNATPSNSAANQVLRGIGFRGGTFTDSGSVTPLTVAPGTETSVGHPAFFSNVMYPTQVWTANYFNTIDGANGGTTTLAVAPAQYRSSSPGSTSGVMRVFSNLSFRLYYLGSAQAGNPIANPWLLDPAPNILGATASNDGSGNVTFQVRVQNIPLPNSSQQDLQDVWVTYNDPSSPHQWVSVDLSQATTDPTLWTGTASGLSNGGTVYMVQAANASGLVSLDTNNGSYFTIAPATPPTPVAPTITLSAPPTSGAYQTTATFTVSLQAADTGLAGQPVAIHLGSQEVFAPQTDSNGQATIIVPLSQAPGTYNLWASFDGATVGNTQYNAASSATSQFTINQLATALALTPVSSTIVYGGPTGIAVNLQANGAGLAQKSVTFSVAGNGLTVTKVVITDANGNAPLGTLSLPAGAYTVSAAFASTNAAADPDYQGSSASTSLTVQQAPQTITFGPLPKLLLGVTPFTVSASGGASGNPVTVTSGPSTVCTASGATITIIGVGTCTVTANQAGNTNYLAAAPVVQSFAVAYPPLYLTLGLSSSPAGNVTTGSTVTTQITLGNHTMATQSVTLKVTLAYTGSKGSLSLTVPLTFPLPAGQTLSKSASFPISAAFPRGSYKLSIAASDKNGDTAAGSATLTVV